MVDVRSVALPQGQGCRRCTQGNLVATRCQLVVRRLTIEPRTGVTGRRYPGHTGRPAGPDGAWPWANRTVRRRRGRGACCGCVGSAGAVPTAVACPSHRRIRSAGRPRTTTDVEPVIGTGAVRSYLDEIRDRTADPGWLGL